MVNRTVDRLVNVGQRDSSNTSPRGGYRGRGGRRMRVRRARARYDIDQSNDTTVRTRVNMRRFTIRGIFLFIPQVLPSVLCCLSWFRAFRAGLGSSICHVFPPLFSQDGTDQIPITIDPKFVLDDKKQLVGPHEPCIHHWRYFVQVLYQHLQNLELDEVYMRMSTVKLLNARLKVCGRMSPHTHPSSSLQAQVGAAAD